MGHNKDIALYIDPPSHHFLGDRLFDVGGPVARYGGHHLMAPYAYVRDYLAARGVSVHTADYMPPETGHGRHVYVSMGRLESYRRIAKRRDTLLSAFFAVECPIVEPSLYRALGRVQEYFRRIFSWSDSESLERFVGGPIRCESFRWPQSFDTVHEPIWKHTDRDFLVMINTNRLPRLYWQELYTARMRAVAFFSQYGEIDLYGHGWDRSPFRVGKTWVPWSIRRLQHKMVDYWQRLRPDPLLTAARKVYRGRTESKAETLGQYTFALCFENAILKGWITEKIFDCFFSGTIPIYWGAPDIEAHVPPQCFIDMRRFAGYEELRDFLKSLGANDIRAYKENARAYLESPQFQPFSKQTFAERFARIIEEDTGLCLS